MSSCTEDVDGSAEVVGTKLDQLPTPCLLVNVKTVQRNTYDMITRCKGLGLQLRPNMKTHKCREAALLATGGTKRCISVSTLAEAEFFANDGFDDLLYASLFTADKLPRVVALAERLTSFHVLVDSTYGAQLLADNPLRNGRRWSVFLKVDVGSCRGTHPLWLLADGFWLIIASAVSTGSNGIAQSSGYCSTGWSNHPLGAGVERSYAAVIFSGVLWDEDDEGVALARLISTSAHCTFRGVYAHESQTYTARGVDEIKNIAEQAAERILHMANRIRQSNIECKTVGLGATPSASQPSALMKDLTELHPGNYIFYDVMQSMIGSCQLENVAVRLASRIIGHYPHRNELLIDAGWTALSQDGKDELPNGSYCLFEDQPNLRLMKMSQEIGYVQPRRGKLNFDDYPIGMMLYLIPYHACATASMHTRYVAHEDGCVVGLWTPCRGW